MSIPKLPKIGKINTENLQKDLERVTLMNAITTATNMGKTVKLVSTTANFKIKINPHPDAGWAPGIENLAIVKDKKAQRTFDEMKMKYAQVSGPSLAPLEMPQDRMRRNALELPQVRVCREQAQALDKASRKK